MTLATQDARIEGIAQEMLDILGAMRQVSPFSSRYPDFDLDQAYAVAVRVRDLRVAHGETPVGRKVGFTNRETWSSYGRSAPAWSFMYDSTVHDLPVAPEAFALGALPEPRIEPEIAMRLARAPTPDMDENALLGCIDWVAHAFEIVYSIFPGWRFTVADAKAACGLHAALLLGDKHPVAGNRPYWREALSTFTIELADDGGTAVYGHARNVLGGPLSTLRFLVQDIAGRNGPPLRAGEIVTTGTLTEARPIAAGQIWHTRLGGIDLQGLQLRLA